MYSGNNRIINVLDKNLRGWLPVVDLNGNSFEICYGTLVYVDSLSFFTILEGPYVSRKVRVNKSLLPNNIFTNFVGTIKILSNECSLILDLTGGQIYFPKSGKIISSSVQANEIEPGNYSILIPDGRHGGQNSKRYISEKNGGSRFSETWFPIVKERFEFRYLHYGTYSNGCATVLFGEGWTDLYFHIITSRKDSKSHGTLIVLKDLREFMANNSIAEKKQHS